MTDCISFISSLALTLTVTLLLLALGIEVTAFLRSAKQKDVGSSPALDQKFFVQVFRLCETFFRKFFKCLQGVPLHFFSILQKNGCSKTPKGPSFTFFGTMRLTGTQKKIKKFKQKLDLFSIFFITRVL